MDAKNELYTKRRKLWTDMLRSGQFDQAIGILESDGKYCSLGIACLAYQIDTTKSLYKMQHLNTFKGNILLELAGSYCPPAVARWLGMSTDDGRYVDTRGWVQSLSNDNDSRRMSFEQIADIIDSNPQRLFIT